MSSSVFFVGDRGLLRAADHMSFDVSDSTLGSAWFKMTIGQWLTVDQVTGRQASIHAQKVDCASWTCIDPN